MAEEIFGLLKKDYVHLGLKKKVATALRDGLAGYIKAIRYCHFTLPICTILIPN